MSLSSQSTALEQAWALHARGRRREAETMADQLVVEAKKRGESDQVWAAQILVLYCEAERSPPPGLAGRAQSLARRCARAGSADDAVRGLLLAADSSAKKRRGALLEEAGQLLESVSSPQIRLAHAHALARTALVEGRPRAAQKALRKVSADVAEVPTPLMAAHQALLQRQAKAPRSVEEPAEPTSAHQRLLSMTLALSQQRDGEQLFEKVARAVLDLLDVDRAVVLMVEDGEPKVVAQHPRLTRPVSDEILNRAIQQRAEVFVSDIALAEASPDASILGLGVTSVICVPMLLGDEVVGALYADARVVANAALGEQAWVLRSLAAHAAVAVGNARALAEQERRVQESRELAHDLRNLLGAVHGAAELLEDMDPTEEQRPLVEMIGKASQTLVAQVTEALAPEPPPMGAVDLAEITQHAVAMLTHEAIAEGKYFDVQIDGRCVVLGRRQDLVRAVMNLLVNALKYGPPSQPVDVWVAASEQRVAFSVRDRGPGIPKAAVGRIFESGYQVPGSKPGQGLGLGLVRRVITDLGGRIGARNAKGGGAVVLFALPLLDSEAP